MIKIILILVTLLPVLLFIGQLFRVGQLLRYGVRTRARITQLELHINRGGGEVCHTTVEFTARQGQRVVGRTHRHTEPGQYHENQEVEVLYNRNDPEQFIINNFSEKYFSLTITGILSLICLIALYFCWEL